MIQTIHSRSQDTSTRSDESVPDRSSCDELGCNKSRSNEWHRTEEVQRTAENSMKDGHIRQFNPIKEATEDCSSGGRLGVMQAAHNDGQVKLANNKQQMCINLIGGDLHHCGHICPNLIIVC